jgi:hypothetical protein
MTIARPTAAVLGAMASSVPSVATVAAVAAGTFVWASIAVCVGVVAWAVGWGVQRRSAWVFASAGPVSLKALPLLTDLRLGVPSETPPQLRDLFAALAAWKPKARRGSSEKLFEADLVRYLNRRFPLADVRPQTPFVSDDGQLCKPDLTFQRSVALELKVTQRLGEVDRAVGQVERYASRWRGPVVVLHCDADDAFLRTFAGRFQRMRDQGLDVAVVAAGRRS